jgi:hypothetical protein
MALALADPFDSQARTGLDADFFAAISVSSTRGAAGLWQFADPFDLLSNVHRSLPVQIDLWFVLSGS